MKKFGALALAATLAACVTPYKPTPFDRSSVGMNEVVIVQDAMPDKATTRKLATNGQNMASAAAASAGLAGLLVGAVIAGVEAGVESAQRERMLKALETQEFDAEAVFDTALAEALTANGYTFSDTTAARDEKTGFITVKAESGSTQAGVLDIANASYGYQLVGGTTWRPFVVFQVRMVDRRDPSNILLDNQVAFNPVATPEVIVNIPADERFSFESIDALEANPTLAAEGLQHAISASAQSVAQLLQ